MSSALYFQIAFFPLEVTFTMKCYYYTVMMITFQAQDLVKLDVSQDKEA